jgi:small basic protein (TIGR04137 family)
LVGLKNCLSFLPILLGYPFPQIKRNVLKRFERVDLLKKRGQWKEGRSVMNLPKTKPDA